MAANLKILFALMSATLVLASFVTGDPNHVDLCLGAKMPSSYHMYGADLHQRHQARTQTCEECCKEHRMMYDYRQEGSVMVCSCFKQRIDLHRKKL